MADPFSRDVTADGVRGRGSSFLLATLAGVIAAILGAVLWMVVQVNLNLQIGFVAIVIGIMVGYAIRLAGNGHTPAYGILGAILTFVGCLGGEILANLHAISTPQLGMLDLLKNIDLSALIGGIFGHMDPISYVIYGIGIFEGYKFSIVK